MPSSFNYRPARPEPYIIFIAGEVCLVPYRAITSIQGGPSHSHGWLNWSDMRPGKINTVKLWPRLSSEKVMLTQTFRWEGVACLMFAVQRDEIRDSICGWNCAKSVDLSFHKSSRSSQVNCSRDWNWLYQKVPIKKQDVFNMLKLLNAACQRAKTNNIINLWKYFPLFVACIWDSVYA